MSYRTTLLSTAIIACLFILTQAQDQPVSRTLWRGAQNAEVSLTSNLGACSDPLQCWLEQLTITIPDQNIQTSVLGSTLTINIQKFTCKGVQLSGFNSSTHTDIAAVDMKIFGLGTTCTGDWSYSWTIFSGSGVVTATIHDSSADLTLEVGSDGLFANGTSLPTCGMNLGVNVDFTGGVTAAILEIFKSSIASAISTNIPPVACAAIKDLVTVNGTQLIQTINEQLRPLLVPAPPPPAIPASWVQNKDSLLDWASQPVYHTLDDLLNQALLKDPAKIDCMVRQMVLDPTGAIRSNFTADSTVVLPVPGVANISVQPMSLQLYGLDSIDHISLFHAEPGVDLANNLTLHSDISLSGLRAVLRVNLSVLTASAASGPVTAPLLSEVFDVNIVLDAPALRADAQIVIRTELLEDLSLGALKESPVCLLSPVWRLNMVDLGLKTVLKSGSLVPVTDATGSASYLEESLDELIDSLVNLFISHFAPLVSGVIDGVLVHPARDTFNLFLDQLVVIAGMTRSMCVKGAVPSSSPQWLDWDTDWTAASFSQIFSSGAAARTLNSFGQCFFPPNASISMPGDLIDLAIGGITVSVGDLHASGLASVSNMSLIQPVSHRRLEHGIGVGYCDSEDPAVGHQPSQDTRIWGSCNPLSLGLTVGIEYQGTTSKIALSAALSDIALRLDTDVAVDLWALGNTSFSQVSNAACMAVPLRNFRIVDPSLSFSAMDIELQFNSGPVERYSGKDFTAQVNALMASSLGSAMNTISDHLQESLDAAPDACAGIVPPATGSGSSKAWVTTLVIVVSASVGSLACFVYLHRKLGSKCRSNNEQEQKKKKLAQTRGGLQGTKVDEEEDEEEEAIADSYRTLEDAPAGSLPVGPAPGMWEGSLIAHEKVPTFVKWAIVLSVLGNVALFISSNSGVGASVGVVINLAGQYIDLGTVSEFTLGNSVHDMWQAGVYPLSLLIAIFSGAWPYLKLLLCLAAWVLPSRVLPHQRRETMLVWLDRLGKWSLIDAYVMVMMLVAFRFHLAFFNNEAVVDVLVSPEYGFYSFLLATMISLALSHIVLAFHRHVATKYVVKKGGPREALRAHIFTLNPIRPAGSTLSDNLSDRVPAAAAAGVPGPGTTLLNEEEEEVLARRRNNVRVRVQCSFGGQVIVTLLLLGSVCLLLWGSAINTFAFEFRGLAGQALGSEARSEHSLINIGSAIPGAAANPDDFGPRWIQAVYFAFGLGFPLGYLLTMLALWLLPMTLRFQRQIMVLSDVAFAWAALEVFILSVIACTLEISTFAQFMLGDAVTQIEGILGIRVFDLIATLGDGCYVLFASSLVFIIVGLLVAAAADSAMKERLERYNARIRKTQAMLGVVDSSTSSASEHDGTAAAAAASSSSSSKHNQLSSCDRSMQACRDRMIWHLVSAMSTVGLVERWEEEEPHAQGSSSTSAGGVSMQGVDWDEHGSREGSLLGAEEVPPLTAVAGAGATAVAEATIIAPTVAQPIIVDGSREI